MRSRLASISLATTTAATMFASPAFAQTESDAPVSEVPVADQSSGDAVVTLVTTTTPAVLPGQDAWVHLVWAGDPVLDARNFKVTAVGSPGVEVGYPEDAAGTVRDYTSLFETDVLLAGGLDFTALRLVVDPEAVNPSLTFTVSYDSDAGSVTTTANAEIAIDQTEFTGEALDLGTGSLGTVDAGGSAWLPMNVTALRNVSGVKFRVVQSNGFTNAYPNEVDYSSLSNGDRMTEQETDFAATRFDAVGMEPGIYPVTIEATYFVGFTKVTQLVERTVEVLGEDDAADDQGDDVDDIDDGSGDDGSGDTGSGDDGSGDTGSGDDDSDDNGSGDDDSDDSDSDDPGPFVPGTVFSMATAPGEWTLNPYGTDTAVTGMWAFGQPAAAEWEGTDTELGRTPSGAKGLYTMAGTGSAVGDNDVDNGVTSILSPVISLPAGADDIEIEGSYYLAYLENATSADYFRVVLITPQGNKVLVSESARSERNQDAKWRKFDAELTRYRGQDVRILVQVADDSSPSLIEAALADLKIVAD